MVYATAVQSQEPLKEAGLEEDTVVGCDMQRGARGAWIDCYHVRAVATFFFHVAARMLQTISPDKRPDDTFLSMQTSSELLAHTVEAGVCAGRLRLCVGATSSSLGTRDVSHFSELRDKTPEDSSDQLSLWCTKKCCRLSL